MSHFYAQVILYAVASTIPHAVCIGVFRMSKIVLYAIELLVFVLYPWGRCTPYRCNGICYSIYIYTGVTGVFYEQCDKAPCHLCDVV
jgi:hypothetical protein